MGRDVVAVIGGGNAAQTMAADLTLGGCEVRLYELPDFASKTLGDVLKTGEIVLEGVQVNPKEFKRVGTAKISLVTTDIEKAIKGAKFILVAVPAFAQEVFFKEIIPHLEDGQIVSIHTDNFGSLVFRKMMRDMGVDVNVIVGGWHSMPYGTRLTKPGHVVCGVREAAQIYDTLPSKDSKQFIEEIKRLPMFDGVSHFVKADTVVGVGIENANPVVHVPGSILNVGAMEVSETEGLFGIPKGQWSMYAHGMSPAVARVQIAFYKEELKIMESLGLKNTTVFPERQFYSRLSIMAPEYFIPFGIASLNPLNWKISGPTSVEHRYFTEDIPIGCVARYSFAQALGIQTPVIKAMIELGSIICQKDFFKEGRDLEKMGLLGLQKDEMLKYLKEGD